MSSIKEFFELSYWKVVKMRQKHLTHSHYNYFFTEYFGLENAFYEDKVILDIGCGPRGSLEWADMTERRIGLDPLADSYLKMGAADHKMTYVKGYVEHIPFPDDYFDCISSFNSLDHVKDLDLACREIQRVLSPGGTFLLIVDIHNYPTLTEPQRLNWDLIDQQFGDLELIQMKRLKISARNRIYENLRKASQMNPDDHSNGVLTAMLEKPFSNEE